MIYNARYNLNQNRKEILDYLKKEKEKNEKFSLNDIGSYGNPWSIDYIKAILDIQDCKHGEVKFKGDMNLPYVWTDALNYVEQHGKFDFCVCTHTLEDITNPKLVCDMIGKIAKEGFIAVPSKYAECHRSYSCEGPIRGTMHHRWIYNIENNNFIGYPKLSFTEYLECCEQLGQKYSDEKGELSFFWKDSVNFNIVNNDFFPSSYFMRAVYENLLNN